MSYIDVAIPLVIGLLLLARPQAFVKRVDAERASTLRKIGLGLLAVAALYLIAKLLSR